MDVKDIYESDESLQKAFRSVMLDTAAIKGGYKGKRLAIVIFSDAGANAYLFSLLTALDVYAILVVLIKPSNFSILFIILSVLWFFITSIVQHWYINQIERIGAQ